MKRERAPTKEEFEKLLAWFASASLDYKTLHDRLTRIFISKGCVDAETLADEVMNRVAVRIDKVVKDYDDPLKCLVGFADNVYREYVRDLLKATPSEPPKPPDDDDQQRRELEDKCLTRCMEELSAADRNLFERYTLYDERAKTAREKLARELRLTANALRIKAHRIRKRLLRCMEACLEEGRDS